MVIWVIYGWEGLPQKELDPLFVEAQDPLGTAIDIDGGGQPVGINGRHLLFGEVLFQPFLAG